MGLTKNKAGASPFSLFDIRLKGFDRDVIVFRGSPEEAASVAVSGHVVLAVNEPISIKRINLKMTGVLKMNWNEDILTSRGPSTKQVKYEKAVYEYDFGSLDGNRLDGNSNRSSGTSSPVYTQKSPHHLTSASSSVSLSSGMSTPARVLGVGNYDFPFDLVLPGDVHESLEGMPNATLIYRLVASVERGRFQNNISTQKHVRIVRTLGNDPFDLTSTVSIENIWPNKVEYTIETPSKAVAVGGIVPVTLQMVPLLKGLRLGKIKVQLVELLALASPAGYLYQNERINSEQTIPAPEAGMVGLDKWEISRNIPVPASLAKLTQDCVIGNYVKVSHKLKFAVSLHNPDGHTSELRASLPVYLYISPNLTISATTESLDTNGKLPPSQAEETLFANASTTPNSSAYSSGTHTPAEIADRFGPPTYESRIYDRLWNDVSSAPASDVSTPLLSRRNSFDRSASFVGMSAVDSSHRSQLSARLLALQRQQQESGENSPNSLSPHLAAISPLTSSAGPGVMQGGDYFSLAASNRLPAGGMSPDHFHISRAGSPNVTPPFQDADNDLNNMESLSRVPSYKTALKTSESTADLDLSPNYDGDGNSLLGKSLESSHAHSSSLSSPSSSSMAPPATLLRNKSSSALSHSLHPHSFLGSRTHSSANLSQSSRTQSSRSLFDLMRHGGEREKKKT